MVPWHRILGLALTDLFTGSPFEVEMEKDLSARKQLLDIAVVRKTGPVPASLILPDGLEGLSDFNLFTYKSLHQAVDAWALQELIGHYVNYRKLLVEPSGALLPEARSASMPSPPGSRTSFRPTMESRPGTGLGSTTSRGFSRPCA